MDIAIAYESIAPAKGGLETYIVDLSQRLRQDGHRVHWYCRECDGDALPDGVQVHPVVARRGWRWLRPWRFAAAAELAMAKKSHDVTIGLMKTWGQDVLILGGGIHLASVEHNLRKSATPLGRGVARLGRWLDPCHWSYGLLERRQLFGAPPPLIVAVSRMVARHLQDHYGIGPDRVRVIHNAIDSERFRAADRLRLRSEFRQTHHIGPEEHVGLFVGLNYRLKGLWPLLRAVARLPSELPFRLLVCGNSATENPARWARQLGIAERVLFLGQYADIRVPFFAADFHVHPTFYDPCALVSLEALACGLPTITSIYNGAAELLPPPLDQYIITDPHDASELAGMIRRLCDPEQRSLCARAARLAASAWTMEHHYRALLQVLQEAATRKQAA